MDTLELLRSYVVTPEQIPLRVEYKDVPASSSLQWRVNDTIGLANSIYAPVTDGRMYFYSSKDHTTLDCMVLRVVPSLHPFGPDYETVGMHRGNGVVELGLGFAPLTFAHELMHVFGESHHKPAVGCLRDPQLGPLTICKADQEEIRKKLGITQLR